MAIDTTINAGAPPLLWSDVQSAFDKVNQNFIDVQATIAGASITPVDFTNLRTDVSPAIDSNYNLGSASNKWAAVFTSEYSTISGNENNGVWLGLAQIKGLGSKVELPAGSTVNGSLIIDPDKTFFKEIQVDNDLSIVASQFSDSFNLLSGTGINLTISSGADSIEINNTGVLTVAAGDGISSSTVSGVATVVNTGVRSLQSTAALPSGRVAGSGININGSTGDNLRVTNTGIISVSSGVGITVSLDAATGEVQITNSAPAVNAFTQIEINGDSGNRLAADAVSDVLNITSGQGITLTKSVSTDTLTITVDPVFDLKGSIFGDDSTKIIDAVENKVYGGIFATTLRTADLEISLGGNPVTNQGLRAVAVGSDAGSEDQGIRAVAIGNQAGQFRQSARSVAVGASAAYFEQGDSAVAIGDNAGQSSQGDYAIAVGYYAGHNNQSANSIILNASGAILNGAAAGFYVNPIRSTANGTPLMYNTSTNELFYSTVLEFIGSKISTSDSSGLTVDVQTTFNTDVTIENDLTVTQQLSVQGSRVINLVELQSVVAASESFGDFQARIAALV